MGHELAQVPLDSLIWILVLLQQLSLQDVKFADSQFNVRIEIIFFHHLGHFNTLIVTQVVVLIPNAMSIGGLGDHGFARVIQPLIAQIRQSLRVIHIT